MHPSLKSRWFWYSSAAVVALVLGWAACFGYGMSNLYDGWQEDQINGALGTSLDRSETRGRYIASTTRPDSAGFTYTDVIIEVEPEALSRFQTEVDFPSGWTELDGYNPPLPAGGPDTAPWFREGDTVLGSKGWNDVTQVYQRVVESETATFVFLLVPDQNLLRWRRYVRSAA